MLDQEMRRMMIEHLGSEKFREIQKGMTDEEYALPEEQHCEVLDQRLQEAYDERLKEAFSPTLD